MREWRSRPPASPRPPGPLRRRLQSLLRRSASERWLLLRTWPFLLGVRLALALGSYARVRAWLERRSARGRAGDPHPSRSSLVWAVRAAGRYVPSSRPCLTQALVLDSYLRRAGYPSRLVLGVQRTRAGALEAHAWVESEGRVVLGGEATGRYTELRAGGAPPPGP